MTDNNPEDDWMAAAHAAGSAQARAVKEQAQEGGLRKEAVAESGIDWMKDAQNAHYTASRNQEYPDQPFGQ